MPSARSPRAAGPRRPPETALRSGRRPRRHVTTAAACASVPVDSSPRSVRGLSHWLPCLPGQRHRAAVGTAWLPCETLPVRGASPVTGTCHGGRADAGFGLATPDRLPVQPCDRALTCRGQPVVTARRGSPRQPQRRRHGSQRATPGRSQAPRRLPASAAAAGCPRPPRPRSALSEALVPGHPGATCQPRSANSPLCV